MFGRKKPAPRLEPIEAGRRLVGHAEGVRAASGLLRASAAHRDPFGPITMHDMALSDDPITAAHMARTIVDLRHYAQMTGMDWPAINAAADGLWKLEQPPAPLPVRHGRRHR